MSSRGASVDEARTSRESRRKHLPGLDGLRGIAAFSVLSGHFWQHLSPGVEPSSTGRSVLSDLEQGLTLFFALSGFLLYLPFVSRLMSGRSAPSARQFYFNRVVRIFPAYLVVLLVASYVLCATYVSSPELGYLGDIGSMTEPLQIIANLSLVQALVPGTMGTGLGVSWSLTTELCFYAILPLLGLLGYRVARSVRSPVAAALVAPALMFVVGGLAQTLGILLRSGSAEQQYAMSWGPTWAGVLDRSLLSMAHLFAFGMFAAVLVAGLSAGRITWDVGRIRPLLWVVAVCALVSVAVVPAALAFGLVSAALIALATVPSQSGQPSWTARVLESRLLRNAGLISYSVYLWHVPILNVMASHDLGTAQQTWAGAIGWWLVLVCVTTAVATTTYYGVERPFTRLRERVRVTRSS
ncbi:acyltransferase family protein [Modestobacter excelsi]|uniref:acyltransferase family protein n=1 Tax=Modestobacter excelsi TaxID=2213161 RepID=UPI001C20E74C|nr:acyltransferase [Modestobacter excelsi]